jgi:site-specific DNA-methyltransferase (adenine-specific)
LSSKPKTSSKQVAVKGDCLKVLAGMNKGTAALALCDPPYNNGTPYDAYDDNKEYQEYLEWTMSWLQAVNRVLHKYGALWVFAPDEWVSEIDLMCRLDLKMFKRRHVVWAFTFGQKAHRNFTRGHCHLLYFVKTRSKWTFNENAVRVQSARQAVYNDKRAVPKGKPPDDVWMLFKHQMEKWMTPDTDTWLTSRICGTFKERRKHSPNQIPVPLMERIVLACSDQGDLVIDPFAGTCSGGVACAVHGRSYVGIDVSTVCVGEGQRRIDDAVRQGKATG